MFLLEEFDYEVTKTTLNQSLLNTIIKSQKKTDRKINILAHIIVQSESHMPREVFSDDDDDNSE